MDNTHASCNKSAASICQSAYEDIKKEVMRIELNLLEISKDIQNILCRLDNIYSDKKED